MGRNTLRKGKSGTKSKLGNISRARRAPAHSWRPSKTTVAIVREQYGKILANHAEMKATRKKYIKNSIRAVTRTMKPIRIPKSHFPRAKYNAQSRHRCQPTTIRGAPLYASIFMEPGLTSEEKRRVRRCLDRQMPIIRGIDGVVEFPDGGYIYIIGLRRGEPDRHISENDIYFQPVRSSLEFGAIHAIMVNREGFDWIFAAGEMRKTGNNIEFNMLSGTFMLAYKYEQPATEIADIVFRSLRDNGMTVTYSNDGSPLIGRDVQEHELVNAKDCGYSVELFRDRNKCLLDYKYTVAKEKGQGADFLRTRRNTVKNISANNVDRALANTSKRLYEPDIVY